MGFISIVETVWERLAFVLLTGGYLENGLLKQEGKKKKKLPISWKFRPPPWAKLV